MLKRYKALSDKALVGRIVGFLRDCQNRWIVYSSSYDSVSSFPLIWFTVECGVEARVLCSDSAGLKVSPGSTMTAAFLLCPLSDS